MTKRSVRLDYALAGLFAMPVTCEYRVATVIDHMNGSVPAEYVLGHAGARLAAGQSAHAGQWAAGWSR